MPVRPVLMVLYTNDAVEVRYSDSSRLHVLPCGTAFSFHSKQDAHPAHGLASVQQRCQYVTSAYRSFVLAAIDFRNRFAERPFLCRELQQENQVIDLYANVTQIGWPKQAINKNCEVLEDGSVRVTSEDEFGSLILSPHRKDFTISYLSKLSCEKLRKKCSKNKNNSLEGEGKKYENRKGIRSDKQKHSSDHCVRDQVGAEFERVQTPENIIINRQKTDISDDLNISPITQASCTGSPGALSNASGSPISPLDNLKNKGAKFRPFSTPTNELDDDEPMCTPYGSTAVFHKYKTGEKYKNSKTGADNIDGSYLDENPGRNTSHSDGHSNHRHPKDQNRIKSYIGSSQIAKSLHKKHTKDENVTITSQCSSHNDYSRSSAENSRTSSCDEDGIKSETKCSYCWVTRHMSCDECPITWSSALKTAQAVAEDRTQIQNTNQESANINERKSCDNPQLRTIKRDSCTFSTIPSSLPLSCPGLYLHKTQVKKVYYDEKNPLEDPTTFCQGHLKVLLIDGVIYRIVRHSCINVVEVYPGDGTVLVSQGMSAHFFLHIIPQGQKIEERTYSLKSLPPVTSGTSYSIKSLMNRASRFLAHVRQEDSTSPASVGLCCWKHEEMTLSEPISTSVLEECTIPGYGKFTALSNGQVRIVFTDRTCLDMSCDFSRRIRNCMDHSHEANVQVSMPDKKADTCRLLLPNGQYQMVDVRKPGMYKRYVDLAREWTDWVNSSPTQRETFYKSRQEDNMGRSVEREIQRIQTFNYLVEHTVLKKPEQGTGQFDHSSSGAFIPYTSHNAKPGPSILRTSKTHDGNQPIRNVHITSPSHPSTNKKSRDISALSCHSLNSLNSNTGKTEFSTRFSAPSATTLTGGVRSSGLEGFDAVREALLRTSSAIKDIDHILGEK